jgi:spermidine synthase
VVKEFPHLFLVLLIEGGALMAVELMGAKLVAPFYGNSLYVWTAVLTITVLGLTLGYYIGGRLARKGASETTLFVVLQISAVLVLALPMTVSIAIALTKGMDLILGICVTCILVLLPPTLCFGIVGPMVVNLMSSQLETVGKTAGAVYFTSTFGGIAATFFFGLYFIPVAGLRWCATVTGLALAALPVIYIAKRAFGGKTRPASSAFARLRPDKPISATAEPPQVCSRKSAVAGIGDAGSKEQRDCRASAPADATVGSNRQKSRTKLKSGSPTPATDVTRTIYLFAVLEGATVMAVELMSARMVAPYFGLSLYVWATVIGFTLLALATGYFLGGLIADKSSGPDALLWVLLIASVFLLLMHVSASLLTIAFENIGPRAAVILVSLALILPPLTFLGMVPTFLIRRVSATADHAGGSTGIVYAISSASGIIALPLFGFLIIPRYGLTLPSIVTGLAVGAVPFAKLVARKKYASLLLVPVILFSFGAIKTQQPGKGVEVQYFSEGLLGQLLVADVSHLRDEKFNHRYLFVNRIGQTCLDRDTLRSKWGDIYYLASICSKLPEKSDALILGVGGGAFANILQNNLGFNVDAVELDRRVPEVARHYFGLSDKVNIIVDDARHYLEETQKKYDVIAFDAYRGEFPPPHVFSLESLTRAKSLLKKDGLIVVNYNGFLEGNAGRAARSIYKTLLAAGLEVRILPTPGAEATRSVVFVASRQKQDFHTLRMTLSKDAQQVDIETFFYDPQKLDFNDAVILTDDKPILELLNIPGGKVWRKTYTEMTKAFCEEGVPLFR